MGFFQTCSTNAKDGRGKYSESIPDRPKISRFDMNIRMGGGIVQTSGCGGRGAGGVEFFFVIFPHLSQTFPANSAVRHQSHVTLKNRRSGVRRNKLLAFKIG